MQGHPFNQLGISFWSATDQVWSELFRNGDAKEIIKLWVYGWEEKKCAETNMRGISLLNETNTIMAFRAFAHIRGRFEAHLVAFKFGR